MRKITTPDIFKACRLIDKAGVKEKLVPIIKDVAERGTEAVDAGILGILTVVSAVSDETTERAIFGLLAPIFEIGEEELKTLPVDEFAELLEQLGRENDLQVFFKALSGLLRKK